MNYILFCGTDNLAYFDKWFKYEEILKNYNLLVIARDTNDYDEEVKKYNQYKKHIHLAQIKPKTVSSTVVRKELVNRGYTKNLRKYLYVDTINYLKKINARDYWRKSI